MITIDPYGSIIVSGVDICRNAFPGCAGAVWDPAAVWDPSLINANCGSIQPLASSQPDPAPVVYKDNPFYKK